MSRMSQKKQLDNNNKKKMVQNLSNYHKRDQCCIQGLIQASDSNMTHLKMFSISLLLQLSCHHWNALLFTVSILSSVFFSPLSMPLCFIPSSPLILVFNPLTWLSRFPFPRASLCSAFTFTSCTCLSGFCLLVPLPADILFPTFFLIFSSQFLS